MVPGMLIAAGGFVAFIETTPLAGAAAALTHDGSGLRCGGHRERSRQRPETEKC